jgi:hypothetical protein
MIEVQRPAKKVNNNTSKGIQFLSPRHVTEAGGALKLKISEVTVVGQTKDAEPDNFGNPVVVYFADAKGVQYSKGFSLTSDNLADLCDLLGKDEQKWAGKYSTVSVTKTRRGQDQLHFAK